MTTNNTTPDNGATDASVISADSAAVNSAETAPGAAGTEPDRIAVLEAERTDLKERLLRALAEMENLRRRSEREVADARAYAVTAFARDMLTVADNIRRALDTAPDRSEGNAGFVEGIELTERDLLKTLERHGVKRLDPEGSRFDPNMHQAMFEVPNEQVPSGTVVQVVQTGYSIGDRVLRPALVGVSKGGPKAASASEETASRSA